MSNMTIGSHLGRQQAEGSKPGTALERDDCKISRPEQLLIELTGALIGDQVSRVNVFILSNDSLINSTLCIVRSKGCICSL